MHVILGQCAALRIKIAKLMKVAYHSTSDHASAMIITTIVHMLSEGS